MTSPPPYVVVVGGANMDLKARSAATLVTGTSNPGSTRMSPGGVGRNVAENLARLGTAVHLEQEVPRRRLEVAAVEIGVRRALLDDEHLLPQPPQGVRRPRLELVEGQDPDRHRRNSRVRVKARRASGSPGIRL